MTYKFFVILDSKDIGKASRHINVLKGLVRALQSNLPCVGESSCLCILCENTNSVLNNTVSGLCKVSHTALTSNIKTKHITPHAAKAATTVKTYSMLGHNVGHLLEQLFVVSLILGAGVNLDWELLTFPLLERFQDLGYIHVQAWNTIVEGVSDRADVY